MGIIQITEICYSAMFICSKCPLKIVTSISLFQMKAEKYLLFKSDTNQPKVEKETMQVSEHTAEM